MIEDKTHHNCCQTTCSMTQNLIIGFFSIVMPRCVSFKMNCSSPVLIEMICSGILYIFIYLWKNFFDDFLPWYFLFKICLLVWVYMDLLKPLRWYNYLLLCIWRIYLQFTPLWFLEINFEASFSEKIFVKFDELIRLAFLYNGSTFLFLSSLLAF
jgi:hypothetical protein